MARLHRSAIARSIVLADYLLVELYATSVDADRPEVAARLDRTHDDEDDQSDDDDDHLYEVVPDGRLHSALKHRRTNTYLYCLRNALVKYQCHTL